MREFPFTITNGDQIRIFPALNFDPFNRRQFILKYRPKMRQIGGFVFVHIEILALEATVHNTNEGAQICWFNPL